MELDPKADNTKCVYCRKFFASAFSMKRHIKQVHLVHKEQKCEICGKRFAHKQYLQEHMNIHTQEEPYSCDQDGCN